jgi:hypothetical protein
MLDGMTAATRIPVAAGIAHAPHPRQRLKAEPDVSGQGNPFLGRASDVAGETSRWTDPEMAMAVNRHAASPVDLEKPGWRRICLRQLIDGTPNVSGAGAGE